MMTTTPCPSRPPESSHLKHLAQSIWKPLLGFLAYSLLATWVEVNYFGEDLTVSSDLQAVASLFLGSLLALRLNTSYNKWWEARTLWGRLVNEERNMAAYVASLPNVDGSARAHLRGLLVEFPKTLMAHLRSAPSASHGPARISGQVFSHLQEWRQKDCIDGWQWSRLALVGESLLQVCGGCERIRSSPLIRSYHLTILTCIWIYLLAAPLVLHHRPWTIPLSLLIATIFLCLEQIASDIDEPFGVAPEDLPLERLCQTIAATVTQLLPVDEPPAAP
jgi:putative membrane protein